MSAANLILATLRDSGPADLPDLLDAVGAAGIREAHAVETALFGLIRENKVAVSCGLYSSKGE